VSKTNHRIYKERPSREDESIAHKKRRKVKQLVSDYIEQYELYEDDDIDIDEFFLEDTIPIKKKPLKSSSPR
jgi:hypothetical protein